MTDAELISLIAEQQDENGLLHACYRNRLAAADDDRLKWLKWRERELAHEHRVIELELSIGEELARRELAKTDEITEI